MGCAAWLDAYYDTGFVSNEFKLTSELHVRTEQDGLFVRGTAWYDTQIMDNDPSGDRFATHNTDSDERYPSDLRNRAGHRARLLDAYLYTNRYAGEMPYSLRFGRQVINWGEGIYYADGINVINPVDIGRVVLPNASLKDALLPTNMISGQLGLTDAFNIEAFYGLEWKGHELIPTGAFLNNQDYFGKGSNGVLYPGEVEHRQEQKRGAEGVEIEDATWKKLGALAEEGGIAGALGFA